jgi:hypothetical protein
MAEFDGGKMKQIRKFVCVGIIVMFPFVIEGISILKREELTYPQYFFKNDLNYTNV